MIFRLHSIHPVHIAARLLVLLAWAPAVGAQTIFYHTELDAAQADGSSTASGLGEFVIDPINNIVGFLIQLEDLNSAETRATWNGPSIPGFSGPVLADLPLGNLKIGVWQYDSDEIEINFLAGLVYVEVQTKAEPGGAIRGQVLPRPVRLCTCTAAEGDAPCGNYGGFLTGGCRNAHGTSPRLDSTGLSSFLLDSLRIGVSNLPPSVFAIFCMSQTESRTPFGNGLTCVAGQLWRFPLQRADTSGQIVLGPGIVEYTHDNNPFQGRILPAQTWIFQCWYRDPHGLCAEHHNMTDALRVLWTL